MRNASGSSSWPIRSEVVLHSPPSTSRDTDPVSRGSWDSSWALVRPSADSPRWTSEALATACPSVTFCRW